MNPLHDILSSIDPAKARVLSTTPPVQRLGTGSPKPLAVAQRQPPRPVQPANGSSEVSALKRKASGSNDLAQNKIARKDAPPPLAPTNGARSGSAPAGARSTSTTPTTSMPYRGTAGLSSSKAASQQVKKPVTTGAGASAVKATTQAAKPIPSRPVATASGASAAPAKKGGGYLAMLQRAKEKDAAKPAAPPVKAEPTKIMSKKEREAARLAAKTGKGKKPPVGGPARAADPKASAIGAVQEKRKPADLGYQGTARPAKKPVEVGYKGTARAAPAAASVARPGASSAIKKKPQPVKDRYAGYANWSDLDDEDLEDEEDGYGSDGSSDMEGGIWDVEREEAEALKAAKFEDAKELAEENRLKKEKEERRKKLAAMNKAAAAKRKY